MKKIRTIVIGLLCVLSAMNVTAQAQNCLKWKSGPQFFNTAGFHSVSFSSDPERDVSDLNKSLKAIKQAYQKKLSPSKNHPKFINPVRAIETLTDSGFYVISAYVDHDSLFPDHLKDYNCGQLTYDLSDGYNHTGTDFFLWPFPWHKMYTNQVEVVAAAPGILLYKQDGNFDQQCELNSDEWNGAAVLHADGSSSWYLHLKKNSLTQKNVGETIEAGEALGIVGSSGSSTSPHLHFEVYDPDDVLIDPFFGTCNPGIDESWWIAQEEYQKAGVNKICTNNTLPVLSNCPDEEIINEDSTFYPGDTIFLMSYFTNIFQGDQMEIKIIRPDGSLHSNWIWTSPWEYYNASWLYFFTILDENEMYGTWTYTMQYKGKTYQTNFNFLESNGIDQPMAFNCTLYPNPATDQLRYSTKGFQGYSGDIRIYNSLGLEVIHQKKANISENGIIKLGILPTGIYFIEVKGKQGQLILKFIKQ